MTRIRPKLEFTRSLGLPTPRPLATSIGICILAGLTAGKATGQQPPSSSSQARQEPSLEQRVRQLEAQLRALQEEAAKAAQSDEVPPRADAQQVLDRQPDSGLGRGEEFTDASFLKSVPLFGSDWRFSFGGYAKTDVIHDFDGTGDKKQFTLSTIPVNGDPPPGSYTNISASETRLSFEVRDTSVEGKSRVFIELDFFDESSPLSPRLRHAYFEYGNLLVGRTWTTLTELRQLPFMLDFASGDSIYGGRTEQIRWQADASDSLSYAIALENRDDGAIGNPSGLPGTARSDIPRLVGRLSYQFEQGVATVGAAVTQNRFVGNGVPDDSVLAWSVMTGGRVYVDSERNDFVGFGASYNDGAPNEILTFLGSGNPNAVLGPDGKLSNITAWNLSLGLHKQWSERWSSNFHVSYAELDPVAGLRDDAERVGASGHANIIFKVNARLTTGFEYMHGLRELVSGDDGYANRVQLSIIYYF